MDKNAVMTKCRKVHILLRNNRIFGYGNKPEEEFDMITVFRELQNAESALKVAQEPGFTVYNKPGHQPIKHKVGSFYMVPASLIEK